MKGSAFAFPFFSEIAMNPFLFATLAPARRACDSLPFAAARRGLRLSPGTRAEAPDACPHSWARRLGAAMLGAGACVLALPAEALDVNSASITQLQSLRGLGPKTARIIVLERERGGSFESLSDLADRVRGIGEKKKQSLEAAGLTAGDGRVEVGGNGARPAPAGSAEPVLVTPPGEPHEAAAGSAASMAASGAASMALSGAPSGAEPGAPVLAAKPAPKSAAARARAARAGPAKMTAAKPAAASPKPPALRRPRPGG
jgi:competence protein ComEA